MYKLKTLLHTYLCVMSCVVLATALFITIFLPHEVLGVDLKIMQNDQERHFFAADRSLRIHQGTDAA